MSAWNIPAAEMRCDQCSFWKEPVDADFDNCGECHRYAPQPSVSTSEDTDDKVICWWPVTSADDFCGDFHPKAVDNSTERPAQDIETHQ